MEVSHNIEPSKWALGFQYNKSYTLNYECYSFFKVIGLCFFQMGVPIICNSFEY